MIITKNIQPSQLVTKLINHSSCNTDLKAAAVAAHIFALITNQKNTQKFENIYKFKAQLTFLNHNEKINAFKKLIQDGSLLKTELIPHETPTYQTLKDIQEDMINRKTVEHDDLELLYKSTLGYLDEPKDQVQFNQLLTQHVEKPTKTDNIPSA
jgi:hypothetical protein